MPTQFRYASPHFPVLIDITNSPIIDTPPSSVLSSTQMATSSSPLIHDDAFRSSPDRQHAFLKLVASCHSITAACDAVGIERCTAYRTYHADPAFAEAWNDAIKARGDWWEDRLRQLGDRTTPDTLATIVGLKKEGRFVEPQYAAKLNLNLNVTLPFDDYTADQLRALLAKLEAPPVVEGEVIEVKALPKASEETPDASERGA